MKIKEKITILIIIGTLILAKVYSYSVGETGLPFLKIGVGAKACAMGEAFAGIADDATAIYWNPAGLAQLDRVQILGMQNFWLLDMSYQYLAVAVPSSLGIFGGALAYSSSGNIPKYENFQELGEYSAYDASGTFSYANKISRLSFGFNIKILQQKIEEENTIGLAGDLGLFYPTKPNRGYIIGRGHYSPEEHYRLYNKNLTRGLRIGIVLQNIGPKIKFTEKENPLPFNIKGGISYQIGPLLLTSDINKPNDNKLRGNFGGEIMIADVLFLRTGYNTANSLCGGIGIMVGNLSMDYAFTPYKEIDNSHRISIKLNF